ncbi:PREDICTED: translation initiation factor IF-2-like, partial [Chinchilla lanigera]|uniref:translation initiation factor IF-2-like n=1 Tax=Chinchilla lanigera TaxID=34839 RepID=UPI0006982434
MGYEGGKLIFHRVISTTLKKEEMCPASKQASLEKVLPLPVRRSFRSLGLWGAGIHGGVQGEEESETPAPVEKFRPEVAQRKGPRGEETVIGGEIPLPSCHGFRKLGLFLEERGGAAARRQPGRGAPRRTASPAGPAGPGPGALPGTRPTRALLARSVTGSSDQPETGGPRVHTSLARSLILGGGTKEFEEEVGARAPRAGPSRVSDAGRVPTRARRGGEAEASLSAPQEDGPGGGPGLGGCEPAPRGPPRSPRPRGP